jgi:hypothetical protein
MNKKYKAISASVTIQDYEKLSLVLKKNNLTPNQFNLKLLKCIISNEKVLEILLKKINT